LTPARRSTGGNCHALLLLETSQASAAFLEKGSKKLL
jgi:hypothetical protein